MSALHVETIGSGPDLVLVHGWGLHGGAWGPAREALAARFRLSIVDLPGHGASHEVPLPVASAETWARAVLEVAPPRAAWLGWSLGGLITLAAARLSPSALTHLVLVGSTPRFVSASDWASGMLASTLAEFSNGLEQDFRATLQRFLSLQLGSGEAERALLRELRSALFARGEPAVAALRAGLRILADTDLRTDLPAIDIPALVLHGGRDRLVPAAAGEALAASLPRAKLRLWQQDGHTPFLRHPQEFAQAVSEFVHD